MSEVAATLRIPLDTAWNRLRLARADLQAAVARLEARRSDGVLALLAWLCREDHH